MVAKTGVCVWRDGHKTMALHTWNDHTLAGRRGTHWEDITSLSTADSQCCGLESQTRAGLVYACVFAGMGLCQSMNHYMKVHSAPCWPNSPTTATYQPKALVGSSPDCKEDVTCRKLQTCR